MRQYIAQFSADTAFSALELMYFCHSDESGLDPNGPSSANPASLRSYPGGGYVSLVIPFFSATWLPDEKGTHMEVSDFRVHRAHRGSDRMPRYYCVRIVWNGDWMHQLCDPNAPGTNRTTGVVRAAVEEWWNDLKRAHWLDRASRAMTLTLPFYSNNAGVRSRVTFTFELTSANTVLPSFDSQVISLAHPTGLQPQDPKLLASWHLITRPLPFPSLRLARRVSFGPTSSPRLPFIAGWRSDSQSCSACSRSSRWSRLAPQSTFRTCESAGLDPLNSRLQLAWLPMPLANPEVA